MRADAAGGSGRGRDRALLEASASPEDRSSQFAPMRCTERLRFARRSDPDESRTGRIAKRARHQLACGARSNRDANGGAQIALLDFAAIARSDRTQLPPANDRRPFAGAGSARFNPNGIKIDPRYRARSRTVKSGFRQRARSSGAENVASANPEVASGIAKTARSPRFRQGFYCGGRRLACNILQRAAGTAATTEFIGRAAAKSNPGNAGAGREINEGAGG